MNKFPLLYLLISLLLSGLCPAAGDMVFSLPTDNRAIYGKGGDEYYMYVDRTFEGETTRPWQGGTWGMVRNPYRDSNKQLSFSRLHEGIDVKPIRRDANNEPLDKVRPIAPGTVAYVSNDAGKSNYGRYIIIAHHVTEGTIYSLYAHLAATSCSEGQQVTPADTIGVLGYTGVGLNKTRAHLHLEICLMINSAYDLIVQPPTNKHGLFNGLNLIGINVSDVLRACKNGQPFSLSRYFSTLNEHYRVRVPYSGKMDFLERYPFLYKGTWGKTTPALDIAFTQEGIPIAIYPSAQAVSTPTVVKCKPMPTWQQNCTVNRLKGNSKNAALTASGLRYINLFLWHEGLMASPDAPH